MSYYHITLVDTYGWLTVNSMFAASSQLEKSDRVVSNDWELVVRTIFKVIFVGLGIIFAIIQYQLFWDHWSPFESGRCFLSTFPFRVNSWRSDKFWIATLILTCVAMVSTAFARTRNWLRLGSERWVCYERWFVRSAHECRRNMSTSTSVLYKSAQILAIISLGIFDCFSFIVRNFLGVWGFFPCAPWVSTFLYVWFCITNTYYAIDVKWSNQHLLQDSETDWGFGQILPLVVLLTIVFSGFDAFTESGQQPVRGLVASPQSSPHAFTSQSSLGRSSSIKLQDFTSSSSRQKKKKNKKWTT